MTLEEQARQERQERQERAAKRSTVMVIRKAQLGHGEVDFTPISGAQAISLATRLTAESFSLARLDTRYPREGMVVRFVPRTGA